MQEPGEYFYNPDDISVNGNYASTTALEQIESLAGDFIETVTPCIYRRYGYINGKASIVFSLVAEDGVDNAKYRVGVGVGFGDLDNSFYVIELDEDNALHDMYLWNDVGFSGLIDTLNSLLETEPLDETERLVVNHLISGAMDLSLLQLLDGDEQLADFNSQAQEIPADTERKEYPLNELLKTLIESKTVGLRIKEFTPETKDLPQVVAHEFLVPAELDGYSEFPLLQIAMHDLPSREVYYYTQQIDGERTLFKEGMDVVEEGEDEDRQQYAEQIEEMEEDDNHYKPNKDDVKRLGELLTQAWMAQYDISIS